MTFARYVRGVARPRWLAAGAVAVVLGACGSRVDLGGSENPTMPDAGGGDGGTSETDGGPSDGAGAGGVGGTGGAAGQGGDGGSGAVPQQTANKVDLVFVIDNSVSMLGKQQIFELSLSELVGRLTNPACVDAAGRPVAGQPLSSNEPCPAGSTREFPAVTDLHVGVVSSSLGGHGADNCSANDPQPNPTKDDKGHLIGTVRPGLASYQSYGFAKWDPLARANPPGESDSQAFLQQVQAMIASVGEIGCGYEAPLEALYRFLVDPMPPLDVVRINNVAVPQGVDEVLLSQRRAFLRPDSAVIGVVLSDENDCSIMDRDVGWLAAHGYTDTREQFFLPRATAACESDPNSPCCMSCATTAPNPDCASLPSIEAVHADPGCLPQMHDKTSDAPSVRCWEQKRRFGFDFLYPVQRYADAFTRTTVVDREGRTVENPLFAGGQRTPSLVSVGVIVGVPWQDLARDHTAAQLELMSSAELTSQDRWKVILGSPDAYVRAQDPLMIESTEPRSGVSPIVGLPLAPTTSLDPTAAPNGHEFNVPDQNELQYACIFPLVASKNCDATTGTVYGGCDCPPRDAPMNRPVCNPPGGGPSGTIQYYAKAYPGLRELDLAKRLGDRSFVASICPKSINPSDADYGYRPAFGAMMGRLSVMLE